MFEGVVALFAVFILSSMIYWMVKGVVGSILAVMFGYTVHAEWVRVIVHLTYLAIALPSVVSVYREDRIHV